MLLLLIVLCVSDFDVLLDCVRKLGVILLLNFAVTANS